MHHFDNLVSPSNCIHFGELCTSPGDSMVPWKLRYMVAHVLSHRIIPHPIEWNATIESEQLETQLA